MNVSSPAVEQLAHMAPVHADVGDRPVAHDSGDVAEGLGEEAGELRPAHLAGGKGELAVLDRAEPADVAVDLHVVGWIGEDEVGPSAVHQRFEVDRAPRVAAQQPVTSELPEVARCARPGSRRHTPLHPQVRRGHPGSASPASSIAKSTSARLNPVSSTSNSKIDQRLELDREDFLVPPGIERELVVGQHIGAPLGLGEVR